MILYLSDYNLQNESNINDFYDQLKHILVDLVYVLNTVLAVKNKQYMQEQKT